MQDIFYTDKLNAKEAKEEAQKLSFYPIMFQAARVLMSTGILHEVYTHRRVGINPETIASNLNIPLYGVAVLLESGLTLGVVYLKKGTIDEYTLTKMGFHLLFDKPTKLNVNFTHDVCYKALFHLEESILEGKAAGLKELDIHDDTIYPHLHKLEGTIKKSWFDFDHYYSDQAFPDALDIVFKLKPKHILDIGGNTGRWAVKCCEHDADVRITILDLQDQLDASKQSAEALGFSDRISGTMGNVLDPAIRIPKDLDIIWMSQFLCCFSEEEIAHILTNLVSNMMDNTYIYIMDLYWDRQKDLAAAYALHGTALYFTAIANGNSKVYHSRDLLRIIKDCGLEVVEDVDGIGDFHTIFKCKKQ